MLNAKGKTEWYKKRAARTECMLRTGTENIGSLTEAKRIVADDAKIKANKEVIL